ncbi:MAG TPA: sugar ABC transporter ATP-binding protein [Meiothermus sp.]|nr:sugar ABC transporter ATP-binding protein [Meiothermus sp.]
MNTNPDPILLEAHHVSKRYGATVALQEAAFRLRKGEVHALLGANGSGKSTLAKIIAGAVAPDTGEIRLGGRAVRFRHPLEARRSGIAVVYQELSLVPDLSVQDNLWLGHEPKGGWGRIDDKTARARTEALLELFKDVAGPRFSAETRAGELPPDERQLVEILKAVSNEPKILILDEATASLDARQVERLFTLVRQWKAQGWGIIIVTHRMEEIFQIADRATVLQGGQVVGEVEIGEASRESLIELISGEASKALQAEARAPHPAHRSSPLLQAKIEQSGKLRGLELSVYPGEILGLGGLHGQGQRELLLSLFGALPLEQGTLFVEGTPRRFNHPREAIRAGLAYVPGDRNREGLLSVRSIFENLMLPSWKSYRRGGFLDLGGARREALRVAEKLKLKYGRLEDGITSLSGGNAQKVVLGKWLLRQPKVLLLDDPTKGVDVGAKAEFYRLLDELRAQGMGVVFYSSDDEELLSLCNRVLVLLEGRIVAELSGAELGRATLVRASLGVKEAVD